MIHLFENIDYDSENLLNEDQFFNKCISYKFVNIYKISISKNNLTISYSVNLVDNIFDFVKSFICFFSIYFLNLHYNKDFNLSYFIFLSIIPFLIAKYLILKSSAKEKFNDKNEMLDLFKNEKVLSKIYDYM